MRDMSRNIKSAVGRRRWKGPDKEMLPANVHFGMLQLQRIQQLAGNQAVIRNLKSAAAPLQRKPIGIANDLDVELDTDAPDEIIDYVAKLLGEGDMLTVKTIERILMEMEDEPAAKIAKDIRGRLTKASRAESMKEDKPLMSVLDEAFDKAMDSAPPIIVDPTVSADTSADDGGKAEMIRKLKKFTLEVYIRDKPQPLNIGDYFENPKKSKHNYFPGYDIREAIDKKRKEIKGTDPEAEMALFWASERLRPEPTAKQGGGGGKVTVKVGESGVEVNGRPGFEENAQNLPGMLDEYHRRHVIAWHSIKATVRNVADYVMKKQSADEGFKGLSALFAKLYKDFGIEDELAKKKTELETKLAVKENKHLRKQLDKLPDFGTMTETRKLETHMQLVLSRLNSNVQNLWPGEGYENSLINTYQSVLRNWADEVDTVNASNLGKWATEKATYLRTRTEENGGRFESILSAIHEFIGEWEKAKEQELAAKQAWEISKGTEKEREMEEQYQLAKAFDLKKMLLHAADSYEVDWPYKNEKGKDDHAHLKKHNKQLHNNLLKIAGTFLDWSERKGDVFTKDVNESLQALDTLLRQFMEPSLIGGGKRIPE